MSKLRILSPCDASWDEMRGGEKERHCDACNKKVHDVTDLDEREVQGYVRLRGGASICVRMLALGASLAACAGPSPSQGPVAPYPPDRPNAFVADAGQAPAQDAGDLATRDTDHDGVLDKDDACPNDPGVASTEITRNGCPQAFVGIVTMGELPILQQMHFAKSASSVPAVSAPMIEEIVAVLKASPQITGVEVQGHASKDEHDAQRLSDRRAAAVVAKITAAGIDPKRVIAKGYGATLPIESNDTDAGRAKNRRVEFRITSDTSEACPVHDAGAP